MSKTILTFFQDKGVPAEGLSPTVDIWDVSDAAPVVVAAAMTELSGGFYKYIFTTFDDAVEYSIRSDGGASLKNQDRYQFATNTVSSSSIADAVWDEQRDDHTIVGSYGESVSLSASSLSAGAVDKIVSGTWDEILAGHLGAGSTGLALFSASAGAGGGGPTAGEIADAVWDEATADHEAAGTYGLKVGKKLLTFIKFIATKDA